MCHYCGCRQIPVIRDYIAEHERVSDHGDRALRALDTGDTGLAARHVAEMAEELRSHWQGEENGVFARMIGDETFREHIEPLIAEHRELEAFLRDLDVSLPAHQAALRVQLDALQEHILREEDGIFPATLVTFGRDDWAASASAWHQAHPGQELIAD